MTRLPAAGEPPCYWPPFHVSTLTLRGRELKLFLKGDLLSRIEKLIHELHELHKAHEKIFVVDFV